MTSNQPIIVVKNIPGYAIEAMLKTTIYKQNVLSANQEISVKIKNTRVFVLFLPQNINRAKFAIIVNSLKAYNANLISLPEITAVFNEKICTSLPASVSNIDSLAALFTFYKIDVAALHDLCTVNMKNSLPQKWWQFWK